ncbi:MAG: 8-amino-7-oxononanoate synthase [Saprospiraceae bacterium]|nr:8-amino-7-oxononanoate synthase [Saprospiraceae bacterium]
MKWLETRLEQKLNQRKEHGILRRLVDQKPGLIDFISNDYLGIVKNQLLVKSQDKNIPQGATGARLLSGNSPWHVDFETACAHFFKSDAALYFNSGYDANIGVISCIAGRNELILFDEYCHASILDGIRLSLARAIKFKHNNVEDLRSLIEANKDMDIWIVVESVYSMDGDFAPLLEIVQLKKEFDCALIVDEAHSTGIWGQNGSGLCVEWGIEQEVTARLMTFGKAAGSHGAVVLGSNLLIEYLVNFARSFVFSTAASPRHLADLSAFFGLDLEDLRKSLSSNIEYFLLQAEKNQLRIKNVRSPIQQIIFEDIEKLKIAESNLINSGIWTKAIYPPTVPQGKEQLRICLHSFNTFEEIDLLIKTVANNG